MQLNLLLQHVSSNLQSLLRQRRDVRECAPYLYNDAQLLCFLIVLILLCVLLHSARGLTKSQGVVLFDEILVEVKGCKCLTSHLRVHQGTSPDVAV